MDQSGLASLLFRMPKVGTQQSVSSRGGKQNQWFFKLEICFFFVFMVFGFLSLESQK